MISSFSTPAFPLGSLRDLCLAFLVVFFSVEIGCAGWETVSKETVAGRINGQNGFSWNYGFDIEVKNEQLLVDVRVKLVPAKGVTEYELERAKKVWLDGIQDVWSKRFALQTDQGENLPIFVGVKFSGRDPHHRVIVHPGTGDINQLHWNLLDSSELVAHEFGHMLGVFDEYRKGATSKNGAIFSPDSIMAKHPNQGKTFRRHYDIFRTWFEAKAGIGSCQIISQ